MGGQGAGSTTWTDQIVEARGKVLAFAGQSTSYYAAIFARYNGTDYYSLLLRSDGKLVVRKEQRIKLGRRFENFHQSVAADKRARLFHD